MNPGLKEAHPRIADGSSARDRPAGLAGHAEEKRRPRELRSREAGCPAERWVAKGWKVDGGLSRRRPCQRDVTAGLRPVNSRCPADAVRASAPAM